MTLQSGLKLQLCFVHNYSSEDGNLAPVTVEDAAPILQLFTLLIPIVLMIPLVLHVTTDTW